MCYIVRVGKCSDPYVVKDCLLVYWLILYKGKPSGENIPVSRPIQSKSLQGDGFPELLSGSAVHKKSAEQPTTTSACDSLQMIGHPAPEGAEPPIALSVSIKVAVLLSTIGIENM